MHISAITPFFSIGALTVLPLRPTYSRVSTRTLYMKGMRNTLIKSQTGTLAASKGIEPSPRKSAKDFKSSLCPARYSPCSMKRISGYNPLSLTSTFTLKCSKILAEDTGFEPVGPCDVPCGLAIRCDQPCSANPPYLDSNP